MSSRSNCCCGSRDVAASHSQTAVAAAGTLRRHTLRLLLRKQGRCGVTFAHCCCGSRDVEASFWQTVVASAGTLPVVVCGDRSAALAMKLHRFEGRCQTSPPFSAEAKWFSHMPWWSANPPLFQRSGCLRRVIALHIGVDRITRLCHALIILGRLISGEGARSGGCRAARSGRACGIFAFGCLRWIVRSSEWSCATEF